MRCNSNKKQGFSFGVGGHEDHGLRITTRKKTTDPGKRPAALLLTRRPGSVWGRPSFDCVLEANDCVSLVCLFADTKRRSIEAALPHYNCRTEAGPASQRSWIRVARRQTCLLRVQFLIAVFASLVSTSVLLIPLFWCSLSRVQAVLQGPNPSAM